MIAYVAVLYAEALDSLYVSSSTDVAAIPIASEKKGSKTEMNLVLGGKR